MTSPKTLMHAWELFPKKQFGQNFLSDPSTARTIVSRGSVGSDDVVLEIGAGLGTLAGKIWRFGIMGYSCKMENVMLCLCALESMFDDMGAKIEVGAAEAAAYHAYAAHPSRAKGVRAVA